MNMEAAEIFDLFDLGLITEVQRDEAIDAIAARGRRAWTMPRD